MAISADAVAMPAFVDRLQAPLRALPARDDLPVLAVVAQIVGAGVEHHVHELIFGRLSPSMTIWLLRSNIQATLPCSPRLPPFFENMWRISLTVRLRLSVATIDQHGRAARTVAFEHDFVDLAAFQFAGAAHDGALDVVGGHADGFGGGDGGAQARDSYPGSPPLRAAIMISLIRRVKRFPALGVEGGLFVLDRRPFGMS